MTSRGSILSRRNLIKGIGAVALAPIPRLFAQATVKPWWLGNGMPQESASTPKIACAIDLHSGVTDEAIRSVVQLGVYHVLSGGPPIPWTVSQLQPIVEELKAGDVTLGNLMISGFPNTIYGRPGRDQEIENVRQSVEAAGAVGIPVVEYNFYAHRAMEGYYEETGRGGAGLTAADYDRMKDLPPLPDEGAHTLEEMWANITYFLKADYDRARGLIHGYPGGGGYAGDVYEIAYAKAMLQAALVVEQSR